MGALNAKQRLFVAEYIKTKNATRAYVAAGYSGGKNAESSASRLLGNAKIRAAVDKSLARVAEKAELSVADVLKELKHVGFARLKNAYDEKGNLLNVHDMPEDIQSALSGLESEEILKGPRGFKKKVGEAKKVKLADKIRALELIGKHLKMFTDVTEITGKDGGPQVVAYIPDNGRVAKKDNGA